MTNIPQGGNGNVACSKLGLGPNPPTNAWFIPELPIVVTPTGFGSFVLDWLVTGGYSSATVFPPSNAIVQSYNIYTYDAVGYTYMGTFNVTAASSAGTGGGPGSPGCP